MKPFTGRSAPHGVNNFTDKHSYICLFDLGCGLFASLAFLLGDRNQTRLEQTKGRTKLLCYAAWNHLLTDLLHNGVDNFLDKNSYICLFDLGCGLFGYLAYLYGGREQTRLKQRKCGTKLFCFAASNNLLADLLHNGNKKIMDMDSNTILLECWFTGPYAPQFYGGKFNLIQTYEQPKFWNV